MNPNPTIDNDLQKAIDDITKNTNADPVFGDPIAAPAPTPAPAPMPGPKAPAPMPTMPPAPKPFPSANIPAPAPAPIPEPIPAPMPEPKAPEPIPAPEAPAMPALTEEEFASTETTTIENAPEHKEMQDVKEAILRDLAPMVDKLDLDPAKKFDLYKEIREDLHDDSVIASAYEVSKQIDNDEKRADALLYLYDSLK